jgi:thiol-disulfide isomerase/thioredoxin
MNDESELKWNDLVSPTMSSEDYLEQYGKNILSNYNNYEPKMGILEKINNFLKDKKEKLKIVALGADWCPDCNINVPHMIKIVNSMNSDKVDLKILYGVMVNALHKPGETIWHKKRSPPEAVDPKFDLKKIPTFYFFRENNDLIGIIVENPKWESTLEDDLIEILESKL